MKKTKRSKHYKSSSVELWYDPKLGTIAATKDRVINQDNSIKIPGKLIKWVNVYKILDHNNCWEFAILTHREAALAIVLNRGYELCFRLSEQRTIWMVIFADDEGKRSLCKHYHRSERTADICSWSIDLPSTVISVIV